MGEPDRMQQIKDAAERRRLAAAVTFSGGAPAPTPAASADMVSLNEASEKSGIHRSVIERLVKDGRLQHTRESPRKTRVPLGAIAAAYAAHRAAINAAHKGGAVVKDTAKAASPKVASPKATKVRRAAPPPKKPKKKAAIPKLAAAAPKATVALVVYESPQAIAALVRANVVARLMTRDQALDALLERFDPT